MNLLTTLINFLQEFLTFIGYIFLVILMFVVFNTLLDADNSCSSFSDTQDLCSKG